MRGRLRGAVAALAAWSVEPRRRGGADAACHLRDLADRPAARRLDGEGRDHPGELRCRGAAKLNALASLVNNSHGVSQGHGAIVAGRVSPAAFATTAATESSTRTIRMAIKNNAVAGVDISPPFDDHPDRVPLRAEDMRNIIDPVGPTYFRRRNPAPRFPPPTATARCRSSTVTPAST